MLIVHLKTTKPDFFHHPISRGAATIIPLQIVLSRKIYKKVTNRIFPYKKLKSPRLYWKIKTYSPR
jgi:hypothetical protein